MKIQMVPMHDDLAFMGVCTACYQGFDGDEFYCHVIPDAAQPRDTIEVWIMCLGCAALLACNP